MNVFKKVLLSFVLLMPTYVMAANIKVDAPISLTIPLKGGTINCDKTNKICQLQFDRKDVKSVILFGSTEYKGENEQVQGYVTMDIFNRLSGPKLNKMMMKVTEGGRVKNHSFKDGVFKATVEFYNPLKNLKCNSLCNGVVRFILNLKSLEIDASGKNKLSIMDKDGKFVTP